MLSVVVRCCWFIFIVGGWCLAFVVGGCGLFVVVWLVLFVLVGCQCDKRMRLLFVACCDFMLLL